MVHPGKGWISVAPTPVPTSTVLAVAEALTFRQMIGVKREGARMVYLRGYWAKPLLEHEGARLPTSLEPGYACGIATVKITGIEPAILYRNLWEEHSIRTPPITHDEYRGIRVSPSVYTTPEELDRFVAAIETVVREGI